MRHARTFKRALNHLSHLHTFPAVWQMVQDVSFLKVPLQAAWYCLWFSLLFPETVFLQPTHQGGCETMLSHSVFESWNWVAIFRNMSLQKSLKIPGMFPRIYLLLSQNKTKQNQPRSASLYLPVFLSVYPSASAVVRMIVRTGTSRNQNHQAEWDLINSISRYSNFTQ